MISSIVPFLLYRREVDLSVMSECDATFSSSCCTIFSLEQTLGADVAGEKVDPGDFFFFGAGRTEWP